MSITTKEINSQPDLWEKTISQVSTEHFPKDGETIAVIGCGTSWFIAQSYCAKREAMNKGRSDAFTATELRHARSYDKVICLSRSGTTTEIVDVLKSLNKEVPTLLITAVGNGPATPYCDNEIVLDYADEESVVQTRFATTALTLFRKSLGEDLSGLVEDCKKALDISIPEDYLKVDQITFLGTGWTIGLATEAGLKLREAAQFWTETYPAMEYRHGPISIAQPGRLVWIFGGTPKGLADDIDKTGATLETSDLDPQAHLVLAQRLAVGLAESKGLNPDEPRHLTRSIILEDTQS